MVASARQRAIVLNEQPAVPRISDLGHLYSSSLGKLELDLMSSHQMTERQVLEALVRHLETWQLTLDGVVCYDCESMALAARLAGAYGLSYPGVQSVTNCRDKFRSKTLWQKAGLETAAARNPASQGHASAGSQKAWPGARQVRRPRCLLW